MNHDAETILSTKTELPNNTGVNSYPFMSRLTSSAVNIPEPRILMEDAVKMARACLDFDSCQLAWFDEEGDRYTLYLVYDQGRSVHGGYDLTFSLGFGLVRQVAEKGMPLRLDRSEVEPLDKTDLGLNDFSVVLAVPVLVCGQTCGVLIFGSKGGEAYLQPYEIKLACTYASQLGAALRLFYANGELRRLAAIVESSDVAIIASDLYGRITAWNPAAERLYGYSALEAVGQPIDLIAPNDAGKQLRHFCRRLKHRKQGIKQAETVRVTKDGRTIDVSSTISPIYDGHGTLIGTSSIERDISERKLAETRFRVTVESAPNAMILVDDEEKITLINAETERVFGYARNELIGVSVEILLPKEMRRDHQRMRSDYLRRPQKRAMGQGRELYGIRKNGSHVPIEIGLNPISIGPKNYVLASIVDVTERKLAEKERQLLMDQLNEAVEARDTFLSIASHELKTPLTALQLTVQALTRSMNKSKAANSVVSIDKLSDRLESTIRQVDRLNKLVNQLLDVSRITAGSLKLEYEDVGLDELIHEVVTRFSDEHQAECPEFRLSIKKGVVGSWDHNRLDQVLTNLISNAIKYGQGKPIEVTSDEFEGHAVFTVRDFGMGIAQDDQYRIFDRFERVVSERHFGGFGLGLWIARQFVEAHCGKIRVESLPGKGSMFEVVLPKSIPAPN